jgi:probable rRNA maturation factor
MSRPKAAPTRRAPVIDIMIESPLWKAHRSLKALLRRAVTETAALLPRTQGELAIVLTNDSAIRALNRTWRGKDAATNVLSFPTRPLPPLPRLRGRVGEEARAASSTSAAARAPSRVASLAASPASGGGEGRPRLLGDIVIAYETTAREAVAEGKPLRNHLAHLAVHGFLHLLGYDHETNRQAAAMERLEIAALRRLDIPNPYVARGAKG